MEQHKVLLIVISVSLFVAVVLGFGLILFYPAPGTEDQAATIGRVEEPRVFDPIEYIRRRDDDIQFHPPVDQDLDEDVIIVYGTRDDLLDTAPDRRLPSAERPAPEPFTEPVRPAPEPAPPAPTPTPSRAVETPPVRPAPSERTVRVTEYWIQVISSPSRDRVEQAQVRLEERDLGSRITSINVDGTAYFRLRVGPYGNKQEAEKFLEWIRRLEGFEESYISEEYPLRAVNG